MMKLFLYGLFCIALIWWFDFKEKKKVLTFLKNCLTQEIRPRCLSIFLLSIGLIGCTSSSKTDLKKESNCISVKFKVSTHTKAFINSFCTEKLENFNPSKEIIESYQLIRINEIWYFSGLMIPEINFDKEELNKLDIQFRISNSGSYSIQVPITNSEKFFNTGNIKYFEISSKISLK